MNTLDPSQPLVSAAAVPLDLPATRAALEVVGRRLVGLLEAVPDPQAPTRGLAWTLGETSLHIAGGPGVLRRLRPRPGAAGADHRPGPGLRPAHGRRARANAQRAGPAAGGQHPPVPGRDRRAARHPPGPLLRRGDHRAGRPERHPAGRVRHPRLRRRPLHRASLADRGGPRPPDHRGGHRPVAPLRRSDQRGRLTATYQVRLRGGPSFQVRFDRGTATVGPHSPGRLTAGSPSTRSPSCWCSTGGARNGRGSSGASCAPGVADPGWARGSSACSCGPDQPNPLR